MSDIYILQNQDQLFLGKQREWLDGREPGSLFKTPHKDEAVNQMVETTAKDFTQRITVLLCPANDKGLPIIDPELLPPPLPKAPRQKPGAETGLLALELESEPHHSPEQPQDTPAH
jgi:hypothetical protein